MKFANPIAYFLQTLTSLSITEIGAGIGRPVIGMHFFNPAPVMKLVEVISGINTPREIAEKINTISKEIGKKLPLKLMKRRVL